MSKFCCLHAVGAPCQQPITYSNDGDRYQLLKSNSHGVCYLPNPIYYGQIWGPYVQKQEHAKVANSVTLCEEDEGCKVVPEGTGNG